MTIGDIAREIMRIQSENGGVAPVCYYVTGEHYDALADEIEETCGKPKLNCRRPDLRIMNVPILVMGVLVR